jgi:hypothetical protein
MSTGSLCGAKTRAGGTCQQPAGWGTDHPGVLACKWHGGASPTGRKAGRRAAALKFVRGMLGAEVSLSPIDALAESVKLSAGLCDYYRYQLSEAAMRVNDAGELWPDVGRIEELRPQYAEAIKLERDCAKAALDAGVAERQQRLAERQAMLLAAAIADGLQEAFGDLATPERRALFAQVVGQRLLVLEHDDDPSSVNGTSHQLSP